MTVKYDLIKLPLTTKNAVARLARRVLKVLPDTHTIVLIKKPEIMRATLFSDFEMIIFVNAETEVETKRIIAESRFNGGSGLPSPSYRIYDPHMAYIETERIPSQDELSALNYHFTKIPPHVEKSYLNFLSEHLKFFKKHDFLNITTVNSPEMEKSDPLYYQLYITHHIEKGYMIFSTLNKPTLSLPGGIMNQEDIPV